jgi:hypothetical protein
MLMQHNSSKPKQPTFEVMIAIPAVAKGNYQLGDVTS